MCEPMTIMAGIGMASAAIGVDQQGKAAAAQETARRKNMREAVRQANYQDAALQIQDKENLKQARSMMEDVTMDKIKANGAVKTAIGESNLEGRSMERVQRDVDNSYLSAAVDVQRDYETTYTNIWAERDAVRNNLISTIEGSAPVAQPSALGGILQIAGGAASGAVMGTQLEQAIKPRPSLNAKVGMVKGQM